MKPNLELANGMLKYKGIDLLALVVSIVAIIVTFTQGSSQTKLAKASLQPHLTIELIKVDSEPKKGILLKNVGNGPAIITSFKYYKDRKDFENKISHQEWIYPGNKFMFEVDTTIIFQDINFLTEGYAVAHDPEKSLFLLGTNSGKFYDSPTAKSLEKIIIEIEYKSIIKKDKETYHLKFSESFISNNIADPEIKPKYEASLVRK